MENKEHENSKTSEGITLKKAGTSSEEKTEKQEQQVLTDQDVTKIKKESLKVLSEKKSLRDIEGKKLALSDIGSPKMLMLIFVALIAVIVLLYAFFSIASTIFFP